MAKTVVGVHTHTHTHGTNLIKKSKGIVIYIFSLIFSLYTSYLICRLYNINIRGIICITLANIIATEYLTYLWRKNIKYDEIKENLKGKTKITLTIITIIISIITLLLNFNILTKSYRKTSIQIESKELNVNSIIKGIYVNNSFYEIKDGKLAGLYPNYRKPGFVIKKIDEKNLQLDMRKAMLVKIVFYKQEGNIDIKDGEQISTINLADTEYENAEYKVKTNIYNDNLFIIRTIASMMALIYFIGLIVIALKYIDVEKRCGLITIIIATVGAWTFFNLYPIEILYTDSGTYIWKNFKEIFQGKLRVRTPIYPLIIKICEKVFTNDYLMFVCIIQHIIGFIAIIFLYKTLKMLLKNIKIVMFITILYALSPAIIGWNNVILTESLAISGTIILIHFIVKYIKEPKILNGITATIIAVVLTFLRPTSIIYVVFLEMFWIMRFILDRKSIKKDFICFLSSTFTIILIILYAIAFHKIYNIYSITSVMPGQHLIVCMKEGFYKNSNNAQFIKEVEEAMKGSTELKAGMAAKVYNKHSLSEIKDITEYCILHSIPQYIDYIIDLHKENAYILFDHYSPYKIVNPELKWLEFTITKLFVFITFTHCYICIIIQLILSIYKWIKSKQVPWINLGLFAFPLVIIISTFIGTNAEFMRTAVCAVPFTYISIAMLADKLFDYKKIKTE